jgi:cysteine desulfurase
LIYLDNHSTTPVDSRVIDVMNEMQRVHFANAGSQSHALGRAAADRVDASMAALASNINAQADELVITSGATESNNLALVGLMEHPRQKRNRIVTLVTEHSAVLDPLIRLEKSGVEVVRVPVIPNGQPDAGVVQMQILADAINEKTALVSIMMANNEIGVIQPIVEIAKLCRQVGCWLHTDATQIVGRESIDVDALDVDLLSFTGHKMYGPKGVGGLYIRSKDRRVRLRAQIVGGGQQSNRRSGTLNTSGIVGLAKALEISVAESPEEGQRIARLRDQLWLGLLAKMPEIRLNGPRFLDRDRASFKLRLDGNLNVEFPGVEGASMMLETPDIAVSSGSACSSLNPKPSHVLTGIGLSEDQSRSSLRFGIGRFNTEQEIVATIDQFCLAYDKLRG